MKDKSDYDINHFENPAYWMEWNDKFNYYTVIGHEDQNFFVHTRSFFVSGTPRVEKKISKDREYIWPEHKLNEGEYLNAI